MVMAACFTFSLLVSQWLPGERALASLSRTVITHL